MSAYHSDYPSDAIGGGNPYYCCAHCKRSDPEINGRIEGHIKDCDYRIRMEIQLGLRPEADSDLIQSDAERSQLEDFLSEASLHPKA